MPLLRENVAMRVAVYFWIFGFDVFGGSWILRTFPVRGRPVLGALKGPISVTTGAGANVGTFKMWLCESCTEKATVEQLAGGYYK